MNALIVTLLLAAAAAAKDPTPRACVDCHSKEMRLSVTMAKVPARIVTAVQPIAPKKLTGKHPPLAAAVKDVPAKCKPCHGADSKIAPRLDAMMHVIHLGAGATFKGDCASCHKLGAKGTMTVPSAAE